MSQKCCRSCKAKHNILLHDPNYKKCLESQQQKPEDSEKPASESMSDVTVLSGTVSDMSVCI